MEIISETRHYNLENKEKKPLKNSSFLAFLFRQQELEFKTMRLDFLIVRSSRTWPKALTKLF